LTKASEETCGRSGIDDTPILLLAEVWPGGPRTLIGTLDMYSCNEVPVLIGHVLEGNVAEDTGVVQENIDTAIGLDGGFDNLLTIGDTVVVGNCFAASGSDLVDDDIGGLCRSALSTRSLE